MKGGGTSDDDVFAVSGDNDGNLYVVGDTMSTSATFGNVATTQIGATTEGILWKVSKTGTTLWATRQGPTSGSTAKVSFYNVVADYTSANVYVVGRHTKPTGTPNSVNIFGTTRTGVLYNDGVISKVNAQGTGLWTLFLASRWGDIMLDVDLERSTGSEAANVYAAGWSNARGSELLTFGDDSVGPSSNQDKEFLIAKASASGTAQWVVMGGGAGSDIANGIAVSGKDVCMISYTTNDAFSSCFSEPRGVSSFIQ